MTKRGEGKQKKEEPYPITISDWINYLESGSHTNLNLSIVIFTAMITVALFFTNQNVTTYITNPLSIIIEGVIFVILFSSFVYGRSRTTKYQKLSQRIMLGELRESKDVLEEYNKFKKDLR